jgi:hypothetical protein
LEKSRFLWKKTDISLKKYANFFGETKKAVYLQVNYASSFDV